MLCRPGSVPSRMILTLLEMSVKGSGAKDVKVSLH